MVSIFFERNLKLCRDLLIEPQCFQNRIHEESGGSTILAPVIQIATTRWKIPESANDKSMCVLPGVFHATQQ